MEIRLYPLHTVRHLPYQQLSPFLPKIVHNSNKVIYWNGKISVSVLEINI